MMNQSTIEMYRERLKDFYAVNDRDHAGRVQRFGFQFPVAVFGTLRDSCRNNALMRSDGDIWRGMPPYQPASHSKAFLPHFVAQEIRLTAKPGGAAPMEVFDYSEDDYRKMIGPVDRLESFDPKTETQKPWGYQRTLARVWLLSDSYAHPLFKQPVALSGERDLARLDSLDTLIADHAGFDRWVPCWIYSSVRMNRACRANVAASQCPILWDGQYEDEAKSVMEGMQAIRSGESGTWQNKW